MSVHSFELPPEPILSGLLFGSLFGALFCALFGALAKIIKTRLEPKHIFLNNASIALNFQHIESKDQKTCR